jgi:hypothetical protein
MIKLIMTLIIITLFTSCLSGDKHEVSKCNENAKFKKDFFYNISIAEKYTLEQQSPTEHKIEIKAFLKSLTFISKYTKVSMNKVSNYVIGYPNYQAFLLDKKEWIKWYNANKCNNLN